MMANATEAFFMLEGRIGLHLGGGVGPHAQCRSLSGGTASLGFC